MSLRLVSGRKAKVAIRYNIPERLGRRIDLSRVASIVMDVYNGHAAPLKVSLLVTTTGRSGNGQNERSRGETG